MHMLDLWLRSTWLPNGTYIHALVILQMIVEDGPEEWVISIDWQGTCTSQPNLHLYGLG